jgi:RNA polymerase sigma factor (sigma-70 family)
MPQEPLQLLLRGLRRLNDCFGGLSDVQLLERYLANRDEAAFELIVWRHGPTVLGLCRRLLRRDTDVEDAFQATFLALVRKAGSIVKREALGSWLYKVAYRVALEARRSAADKTSHQRLILDPPAAQPDDAHWHELRPLLDDAVMALPQKYREVFVLCCIEGKTNEEACRQLGCPKGTIDSRLARARERLRQRLTRRGVVLSGTLAASFTEHALATVPAALAGKTLWTALGPTADAARLAPRVAALTEGALRAMLMMKLKTVAAAGALSLILAGAAVAWWGQITFAGENTPPEVAEEDRRKEIPVRPGDEAQLAQAQQPPTLQDPQPGAGGDPAPPKPDDQALVERARALRQSQNNLKSIGLALHNHHDTHNTFPKPAIYHEQTNKPLLSWRVAILPYLDQDALYRKFKLDEPWDSPHNLRLVAEMPAVYAPVMPTKQKHATYYQALVGVGTLFEPNKAIRLADVTDGTSNTLAVVEAADPVVWTKPEDLPFVADQALPKLGGQFQGFFNATLADGSVQRFAADADADMLRKAIERGDGHQVDFTQLRVPQEGRGPLDAAIMRLENQELERAVQDAREQIGAEKEKLQALRQQLGKQLGDPKAADLLGANARLRAELSEHLSVLEGLRAEFERLKTMLDKRTK